MTRLHHITATSCCTFITQPGEPIATIQRRPPGSASARCASRRSERRGRRVPPLRVRVKGRWRGGAGRLTVPVGSGADVHHAPARAGSGTRRAGVGRARLAPAMVTELLPPDPPPGTSADGLVVPRDPFYADPHGLVTIYHADSIDLSFLEAESVHLVVTSPPYNLGKDYGTARDDATYHSYLDWTARWCQELWRVLEPGGRLCLNIPIDINLSFDAGGKRTTQKRPVLADFTHRLVNEEGWLYNT